MHASRHGRCRVLNLMLLSRTHVNVSSLHLRHSHASRHGRFRSLNGVRLCRTCLSLLR